MKNGIYYGIDFGTTNTSVYLYHYSENYGIREARFGTDGKTPFSSCIAIPENGEGDILFGRYVKDNINTLSENYRIVTSFKSLLGTEEEIVVNDIRYTGQKLAALFLNHVRENVGRPDFTEAVFSIPVDFSAKARTELMKAAEAVGIKVKGFISESSAAYISKMKDIKAFSRVLVIDWGGGTLDLSILGLHKNKILEEAVYGIRFGGDDIDKELALRIHPYIYPNIAFDELDSVKKDRLIRNIEQMKIYFSDIEADEEYEIISGPGSKPVMIEYETFSEIVTPLVEKYIIAAIGKIMSMANVNREGIDAVILAGGSSGIRPFSDEIITLFDEKKIIFDDSYQWMVAKGAAITSGIDCEFCLCDDVCVRLSDNTLYPVLKKDIHKVGGVSEVLTFSLTDDAIDAHFIFTDSSGENEYTRFNVKTKGYFDEKLILLAEIGQDQIARITVQNPSISDSYSVCAELNQLRFYYDLNKFEG